MQKQLARGETKQRVLAKELAAAVDALQRIGQQGSAGNQGTAVSSALDEQRQRLVDTARALGDIAQRRAAAIRQHGSPPVEAAEGAHARVTKARIVSLLEVGGGRSESAAPSAAAPSEADVLSHVDEWEEAQRHEMHDEAGFAVLSPKHGDMAAAAGRGEAGAQEASLYGSGGSALYAGRARNPRKLDLSHYDVSSMLGHRNDPREELKARDAVADLKAYYSALQAHTKKKALKHGPHNARLADSEARDDLTNFYDDEAAEEGLDTDPKTGLKRGQHDALYELAANGRTRTKHALHRESTQQAQQDLNAFYKHLRREMNVAPPPPRFKPTGLRAFFGTLSKEGRGGHTPSSRPSGAARAGDAVHGWESGLAARNDLMGYFGTLSKEGRGGHTPSLPPAHTNLRRANQALSSASASNDLDYFYDRLGQSADASNKLHTQPKGYRLSNV